MRFVLSGPQAHATKVEKALKSEGFTVVLDDFGDPLRSNHGLAENHKTEWTGKRWMKADLDELPEGHGLTVGDVIHGTGEIVACKPEGPTLFVTVDGDEADLSKTSVVEQFGWVLRAHFDPPAPQPKTSLLQRLQLTDADLTELRQALGVK